MPTTNTNAPALQTLAASLRYNVTQARADLAAMQVQTRDEFYHQGYQTGRIAVMESVAESLELLAAGAEDDDDGQDVIDRRIAEHEEFLASEGADHLFPHGAG